MLNRTMYITPPHPTPPTPHLTIPHHPIPQVPWGAGDGAVGGPGPGTGGGVSAEDVVLPPQADSWMRTAVQQELMREQIYDQAVAQQYHNHHQQHHQQQQMQQQQQQLYAAAAAAAAASGPGAGAAAGAGGGGMSSQHPVDMSQQPLLNAQVRACVCACVFACVRFLFAWMGLVVLCTRVTFRCPLVFGFLCIYVYTPRRLNY